MQLLMALYIVLFLTAVLYSTANARGIPNQAEFVIPQDEDQQMQKTKIKAMIQCWRQLNNQERVGFKNFVDRTSAQDQKVENGDQASTTSSYNVYKSIDLYSYYSYLYYYPTMHWSLDKTPDTNDYWVGIYKVGATDRQYLTYQWVRKTTQGSYKIGQLRTTAGQESTYRHEQFELRIFKGGYQRLNAITNNMYGLVQSPPIMSSYASNAYMNGKAGRKGIHPKLKSFKSLNEAVETKAIGEKDSTSTYSNIQDLWLEFDRQEQDLLYPILEQDCLPAHIRDPDSKPLAPEPLEVYPDLPDSVAFAASTDPDAQVPNHITLTITLDRSITYVYPVVDTNETLPGSHNWLGVYRARS